MGEKTIEVQACLVLFSVIIATQVVARRLPETINLTPTNAIDQFYQDDQLHVDGEDPSSNRRYLIFVVAGSSCRCVRRGYT